MELYPEDLARLLGPEDAATAHREIAGWPGYRPTPLHALPALAGEAGVGRVWYTDEASRFGLGSFKALGGAYALYRVLARRVREEKGRLTSSRELMEGCHADLASDVTATCASEGNHGRSVAWGAQMFGCRCVIYLPEEVSFRRERTIRSHGAEVVRVAGGYDRPVRRADGAAREEGWEVISDTGYPGYREVPLDVMAGYTLLVREALDQAGWEQGEPPRSPTPSCRPGLHGITVNVVAPGSRQDDRPDAPARRIPSSGIENGGSHPVVRPPHRSPGRTPPSATRRSSLRHSGRTNFPSSWALHTT